MQLPHSLRGRTGCTCLLELVPPNKKKLPFVDFRLSQIATGTPFHLRLRYHVRLVSTSADRSLLFRPCLSKYPSSSDPTVLQLTPMTIRAINQSVVERRSGTQSSLLGLGTCAIVQGCSRCYPENQQPRTDLTTAMYRDRSNLDPPNVLCGPAAHSAKFPHIPK